MTGLDVAAMVRRYHEGATVRTVASEFGCSHQTVCNRLRREGVALRDRGYRSAQRTLPAALNARVAANIRARRHAVGLSITDLAELVGVSFQQAHKYDTGTNRVTAGQLYTIASALGVPVKALFEEVDGGTSTRHELNLMRLAMTLDEADLAAVAGLTEYLAARS